jgi:hypothetical protein
VAGFRCVADMLESHQKLQAQTGPLVQRHVGEASEEAPGPHQEFETFTQRHRSREGRSLPVDEGLSHQPCRGALLEGCMCKQLFAASGTILPIEVARSSRHRSLSSPFDSLHCRASMSPLDGIWQTRSFQPRGHGELALVVQ